MCCVLDFPLAECYWKILKDPCVKVQMSNFTNFEVSRTLCAKYMVLFHGIL